MHFEKKIKWESNWMNHYRHELLSIINWYKLINFYTLEITRLFFLVCVWPDINNTSWPHCFYNLWIELNNDETIIMHTNTLYFSYTQPLIKIHYVMYYGKCTSKFEFSGKWQRGVYNVSFTCWIQVFCSNKIQSTDLQQNILCSLFFNNFFVVMIFNNRMMIWIKKYL